MKVDPKQVKLFLARACKSTSDLRRDGIPSSNLWRAIQGKEVTPKTVGRLAKALGVDPAEIIAKEED